MGEPTEQYRCDATHPATADDRLCEVDGRTYTYDARGMLASVAGPDGTATFRYDGMGRLHKATTAAGDVIYYAHDAFGRRIARIKYGQLDKGWIYANGLSPIAQLNSAGQLEATYVYASRANVPDFIVESAGASNVTYRVIANHLGTPGRLVRTNDGVVVYALDVDEWGRTVNESGVKQALVPFGFAGGLRDRDTGLVRFGARDYDPFTGRWTARDPILFRGGQTNLYAYVNNDPINRIDPSGLLEFAGGVSGTVTVGWGQDPINFGLNAQLATNHETGIYRVNPVQGTGGEGYIASAGVSFNVAVGDEGAVWDGPFENATFGPVTVFWSPGDGPSYYGIDIGWAGKGNGFARFANNYVPLWDEEIADRWWDKVMSICH